MPDYSDLGSVPEPKANIVSSLGLSQYPLASIAAWIAIGIGERRFTDINRMGPALQQLGASGWARSRAGSLSNLNRTRAGKWGPITESHAGALGQAQLERFMAKNGFKDLHAMARDMTPRTFDPALRKATNRNVDRALYRGLEGKFGKRFASRMMVGRALGSINTAANMFFLAEVGGMVGNFVGNLILNWRPSPGTPDPRRTLETGGNWVDTRIAYTQRQRAIQAIHSSMLTSRAALGNEASFVHN